MTTLVGVVYWIQFVINCFTAYASCADCKGGCGTQGIKDGNKGMYNDGLLYSLFLCVSSVQ
jgi:hypothetical protein